MEKLKTLGLTGGIAAGKSVVSDYLREKGGCIIDCDKISHAVILRGNAAYDKILSGIDGDYLSTDMEIDRKKLGNIVFNDEQKRKTLERIVHAEVEREAAMKCDFARNGGYRFIVIDAPLLFESRVQELCDGVFVISAPKETRIARIMGRNNLSRQAAANRIAVQKIWETIDLSPFVVIENDADIDSLLQKVAVQLDIFLGKTS